MWANAQRDGRPTVFRCGATAAENVYIVYQPMQVRAKHCARFG